MDAVPPALLAAAVAGLIISARRPAAEHGGSEAEGVAIDADAFWLSARRRKAAFVGVCALETASRAFGLAWHVSFGDGRAALADGLLAAFWTVTIAIALLAFSTRHNLKHWRQIVALASLTALASVASVNELLNSALRQLRGGVTASNEADIVLVAVHTLLSLVATWIIATAPGGPPRFYSKARLAGSQPPVALATAASDPSKANVTPLVEASPLACIAFNWATPIVRLGATIDPSNLPLVQASLRAKALFEEARASTGSSLLRRILHINRTLLLTQFVLSVIAAILYYAPAFFLQQVIRYLEQRSADPVNPPPYAEGLATCAGLFFALLLDCITQGQLYYISNSLLAPKMRTQLNTLVFDKTLRRKDATIAPRATTGPDTPAPPPGPTKPAKQPKPPRPGRKTSAGPNKARDTETEPLIDAKGISAAGTAPPNRATVNRAAAPPPPTAAQDTGESSLSSRGAVLNLFSVDVDRISDFATWAYSVVDAPVELIIGTYFLWRLLGSAALIGIGINIVFVPANHLASSAFARTQDRLMAARDRRIALVTEVLQSVRTVKAFAWEDAFEKRCMEGRAEELKEQRNNYALEVAFDGLWSVSPVISVVVAFLVFTKIQGNVLTPSIAFTSLAVFAELKFALNAVPDVLVSSLQAYISLKRVGSYLEAADVDTPTEAATSPAIGFNSATITWPAALPRSLQPTGWETPRRSFLLTDLTVDFPVGKLSLICGSLGSGKTLALLALLGEADLLVGSSYAPRSTPLAVPVFSTESDEAMRAYEAGEWLQLQCAYCPQTAWLQNATVRENIVFGLPFIEKRYNDVLYACSLVSDLHILEDGDETEIGEKGVNLSGGQKARVSLARAIYSRASHILLDDVLSAVDAHTARHIFDQCLKGPLVKGRTIVLVSHHVQLCAPGSDFVCLLDSGYVKYSGPASDFLGSQDFRDLLGLGAEPDEPDVAQNADAPKPKAVNKTLARLGGGGGGGGVVANGSRTSSVSSMDSSASEGESETEDEESSSDEDDDHAPRKLIEDEARATGQVSWAVWRLYLGSNGHLIFWSLFAAVFVGAKLADVAESLWLRIWSGSADHASHSIDYYLGIYAAIAFSNVIIATARWLVLYTGALQASSTLYQSLLRAVLRAPLRWHDTVALGRLVNRFAKGIDSQLPDHFGRTIMYSMGVLTTVITVASVAPIVLVGFAVLSIGYAHYGRLYTRTARELRRLDSITKSPMFSLFQEGIAGVAVIRAFGSGALMQARLLERAETNINFFVSLWSANRWLSVRYSFLSAVAVGITSLVLVSAPVMTAAKAGFALTFALNLTNDLLFFVRRVTALELTLVAVERVREYASIEQEAAAIVEPRPPAAWPHSGALQVLDLCVRYAPDLPDVLHDVTFAVGAGEKIGVIGATGSGKSTLAQSFFRFVEATSGSIKLDGIDISTVGLTDLRRRISYVPQDPVILSGSLRSALDVFNEHEDAELFEALRRAHLLPSADIPRDANGVNGSPFWNLDSSVESEGSNFSQGQRQLLCIARALLRRSKLTLFDEASASVDYATDELLSATLRSQFSDSTLLVVAHRLRTIADFSRILVLDAGRIVEFDTPAKLLQNPSSRYYALAMASGRREFKVLQKMAQGRTPTTTRPAKPIRVSTKRVATRATLGTGSPSAPKSGAST